MHVNFFLQESKVESNTHEKKVSKKRTEKHRNWSIWMQSIRFALIGTDQSTFVFEINEIHSITANSISFPFHSFSFIFDSMLFRVLILNVNKEELQLYQGDTTRVFCVVKCHVK